jgi:AraC-like DNA-binding protein
VSVRYSAAYLRRQLSACDGATHPVVEALCNQADEPGALGEVRVLNLELEQLAAQLLRPPVAQAARPLWYQGKALQLMAEFFFTRPGDDELLCDRQKRVARQRADAVIAILRQHLDEPLGLDAIARKVGCSPFYLSRTFSQETGMTIPQYLRRIRMERAAELLRSGKYNVTEAALEVGYSSLSHFSQAFCQTMGCCPALYPLQKRPVSPPPQNSVKE